MAHGPVTGRHVPQGQLHSHWDGWNAAVADALLNTGWDPNTYDDVQVELFAKVKVENPGSIVEYAARLTPKA
jgi:hypothetical protein